MFLGSVLRFVLSNQICLVDAAMFHPVTIWRLNKVNINCQHNQEILSEK